MANNKLIKTNPLYPQLILTEWFYIASQLFNKEANRIQEEIDIRKKEFEKEKPVQKRVTPIAKTSFPILALILSLVFLFLAVLFAMVIGMKFLHEEGVIHLAIMFFVIGGIATILAIWQIVSFISGFKHFISYKRDVKRTESLNIAYQNEYSEKCVLYEKRKLSFNETILDPLYKQRDQMKNNHNLLNKAFNHSMNFIYPKYRNIVCVCQFTQYIESGRCETFDGPYGCYNLFEQELRMNLIVNKLDIVISKLDTIIENQHEMVNLLKSIDRTAKEIKTNTDVIVMNTAITALASLEIAGSINDVATSVEKVNGSINSFDNYYRRYH